MSDVKTETKKDKNFKVKIKDHQEEKAARHKAKMLDDITKLSERALIGKIQSQEKKQAESALLAADSKEPRFSKEDAYYVALVAEAEKRGLEAKEQQDDGKPQDPPVNP